MIYVLEDDESISKLEKYALESYGYQVDIFESAESFFQALEKNIPELIILDVMLPDMDGIEILKKIRNTSYSKSIPVIMVTAKSSEIDIVTGLDAGADEYITKPFGVMEFISRVKALLRRFVKSPSSLCFKEISMDLISRKTYVNDEYIELTFKEFELLKLFLSTPNEVVSRNKMLSDVWNTDIIIESRTIDMHIRTLRQKLKSAGNYIQTVRKIGYILTE